MYNEYELGVDEKTLQFIGSGTEDRLDLLGGGVSMKTLHVIDIENVLRPYDKLVYLTIQRIYIKHCGNFSKIMC